MISYTLKCDQGHRFDSWFQSAGAYETLRSAGHLACAECGSYGVEKALMAPRVSSAETPEKPDLTAPENETAGKIAKLRRYVEDNADYVGSGFASEARSMYLGATPERAIYGEANAAEARKLIEDGVPVAPLPFLPGKKAN
ncbi:DUF1178 family protein [Roseobacter ponti]|uniref:DUF1178 family protein n=1 Tax=Roseobacter ponti TaxID=1891787 RepID=A0A858SRR0_9RHOB|nr:DUF1178 family protein [Roseobacter ponti]QJF50588.1 DUF1178 family protein [Roseobacter ponti]